MKVRGGWIAVVAGCSAPLAVALALRFGPDPTQRWRADAGLHRTGGYVGSDACERCHPDHHASWARTFHRTMTQVPTEETVAGTFDGREVGFYGQTARVYRAEGRFRMDLPGAEPGGARRTAEVALVVGSRRYQQYFEALVDGPSVTYRRLPLLWHVEERRWLHANGIFLHPDDPDWDAQSAVWNENCIFCHNTGPTPGLANAPAVRTGRERGKDWRSRVSERGVACEACHGPGLDHVQRHAWPWERLAAWSGDAPDPTIVAPRHLDPERRAALCGQCHGQRLPEPPAAIWDYVRTGPTFRPGARLEDHVALVRPDTPPPSSSPRLFADRFWEDGTPRLTAYEYQGMVDAPCHVRGGMSCDACHVMHGGDPRGMIEPALRGNEACLGCHERFRADLAAHTFHAPASPGSQCMACHMPHIVYGILTVHRSHRIENPDAVRDDATNRPNACTLCHLDRSLAWAERETTRAWRPGRAPRNAADGTPLGDVADGWATLLRGDALARAVHAHAFGREDAALDAPARRLARVPLLVTLLDAYPSVRQIAWRSLRALEARDPCGLAAWLEGFDPQAPVAVRRAAVERALQVLVGALGSDSSAASAEIPPLVAPDGSLDRAAIGRLLADQEDRIISIGE